MWEQDKIVSTKAGEPHTDSVPNRPKRTLGVLKGKIQTAPDFDETPLEVIEAFEG